MNELDGHDGFSEQVEQANKSYTRIAFNADSINGAPLYAVKVGSAASVMSCETWDDESVASEGVDFPLRRSTWVEGVERDKTGRNIIRMCGLPGCQYKTGYTNTMKKHKAAKHGINVVWFSCDQDNCEYKTKEAGKLKQHKREIHNISVVWYHCVSCDYKTKRASHLKTHNQATHNIGVVWYRCNSCDYKAKQVDSVKNTNKLFTILASFGIGVVNPNSEKVKEHTKHQNYRDAMNVRFIIDKLKNAGEEAAAFL
ncbi:hypothetical protein TrLO_g9995, partial [Triparma laevis f. longispina]